MVFINRMIEQLQIQFSNSRSSQTENILAHLRSGRSITPLDALREFGCFRLGGRIYDLKQLGHKIERKMIDVGNNKRVAEYSLVNAENDPSHSTSANS